MRQKGYDCELAKLQNGRRHIEYYLRWEEGQT